MVTRSQVIRSELVKINKRKHNNFGNTSWYLQEDVWNLALQGFSVIAGVLRATNKPGLALAIDAIVSTAQQPLRGSAVDADNLRNMLNDLTQQLRYVNDPSSIDYARIDAQIDLLMRLIKEQERNG